MSLANQSDAPSQGPSDEVPGDYRKALQELESTEPGLGQRIQWLANSPVSLPVELETVADPVDRMKWLEAQLQARNVMDPKYRSAFEIASSKFRPSAYSQYAHSAEYHDARQTAKRTGNDLRSAITDHPWSRAADGSSERAAYQSALDAATDPMKKMEQLQKTDYDRDDQMTAYRASMSALIETASPETDLRSKMEAYLSALDARPTNGAGDRFDADGHKAFRRLRNGLADHEARCQPEGSWILGNDPFAGAHLGNEPTSNNLQDMDIDAAGTSYPYEADTIPAVPPKSYIPGSADTLVKRCLDQPYGGQLTLRRAEPTRVMRGIDKSGDPWYVDSQVTETPLQEVKVDATTEPALRSLENALSPVIRTNLTEQLPSSLHRWPNKMGRSVQEYLDTRHQLRQSADYLSRALNLELGGTNRILTHLTSHPRSALAQMHSGDWERHESRLIILKSTKEDIDKITSLYDEIQVSDAETKDQTIRTLTAGLTQLERDVKGEERRYNKATTPHINTTLELLGRDALYYARFDSQYPTSTERRALLQKLQSTAAPIASLQDQPTVRNEPGKWGWV